MKTKCTYFILAMVSMMVLTAQAAYIRFEWHQIGPSEPIEYTDGSHSTPVPYPIMSQGYIDINKDCYDMSFLGEQELTFRIDVPNESQNNAIDRFFFKEYRADGSHSIIYDSTETVTTSFGTTYHVLGEETPLTLTLSAGKIILINGMYMGDQQAYVGFGFGLPEFDLTQNDFLPNPLYDPNLMYTGHIDPLFRGEWVAQSSTNNTPEIATTLPLLALSSFLLAFFKRNTFRK